MRYSTAIREIEMAILEMIFSVIQLQESLDVTSNGKLSSVLVNPYLSVILQHVSMLLPEGLSMLTGLTVEDMYVYYAVATVHAVATSKNIRLLIDIPLKAADRYFELYQVHSLPFFHEGIDKFVMIDEAFTYLAVAERKQFFALITPYMLMKCTQELYTVCPSDIVLKTAGEPNCLIALFLGKTDMMFTKCKRLILDASFEPTWIRSPDYNYWIYSLSMPRVTIQCQEVGSPPTAKMSYQMTIEGTGILPNSSSCYVHAENFKLLPHSLGRTTMNLTRTHIVLPSVENILNFSEEGLLQSAAIQPEDLQQLDGIVERATSRSHLEGVDISRMTAALRVKDANRQSTHWLWIMGIIIIILFLCIGIVWFIWFKFSPRQCPCIWKCKLQHKQPIKTASDQQMNTDNIELQVMREASKDKTTETDTLQDQGTPTVFVRRGLVATDSP